jgi:hypothetical protein
MHSYIRIAHAMIRASVSLGYALYALLDCDVGDHVAAERELAAIEEITKRLGKLARQLRRAEG